MRNPGRLTREVVREHVRDILLVGEGELESAVLMLLQVEKTVVEGAGACGLAALLKHRKRFKQAGTVNTARPRGSGRGVAFAAPNMRLEIITCSCGAGAYSRPQSEAPIPIYQQNGGLLLMLGGAMI